MKALGTVLPTKKSLQLMETSYQQARSRVIKKEATIKGIKKVVKGETRWYQDTTKFLTVGTDARVRMFETKEDGDYFVSFVVY
jgi:Lon protease-like protein